MLQTMCALTLTMSLLFAPLIQAAVITYGFTGSIDHVSLDDTDAIPDSIAVGSSTVVGYFTYDDAASDADPRSTVGVFRAPTVAIYMLIDGAFDYRGSLGSRVTGGVGVFDNAEFVGGTYDGFGIGLNPEPTSAISAFDANVVSTALDVALLSTDTGLLDSDALLGLNLGAIPLTTFDGSRSLLINAINSSNCPPEQGCFISVIEGNITSLWRIPEPATLALLGLGLAALGVARRKKLAA